jgi:hypothetical protein
VGPDGPQPLANLTIVRAVGCLSTAANDAWTLDRASSPRARLSTNRQCRYARGAESIGGAGARHPDVSADERQAASVSLAGHKVQVKGVLTR